MPNPDPKKTAIDALFLLVVLLIVNWLAAMVNSPFFASFNITVGIGSYVSLFVALYLKAMAEKFIKF